MFNKNVMTLDIYFKRKKKPAFSIVCDDDKLYNIIQGQVKAGNEWIITPCITFRLEDLNYIIFG